MAGIEDRLPMLREARRGQLAQLRLNQLDREKDQNGSASNSLMGTLRFLAVAEYVLDRNADGFRAYMQEAVSLRIELFRRFVAGEGISPSYVSMRAFSVLLSALAAGDEVLAKTLASHMGGRPDVEREYDRPFDIAFGYALKCILDRDEAGAAHWVSAMEEACKDRGNADFAGYARVLAAILGQGEVEGNLGLREIADGHKRQSKGRGLFKDTEDELICVWGTGMANLAISRQLLITPIEPLIPNLLLIGTRQ